MATTKKNTVKKSASSTRTRAPRAVAAPKKKAPARRAKAAPVLNGNKNYPFASKRDLVAQIDSEASAAISALVRINALDAAMCSQKKHVAELAAKVAEAGNDAASNRALVGECRALARRYGRRLALDARAQTLASNPELSAVAELFSANVL